jgi:hypothetical protein
VASSKTNPGFSPEALRKTVKNISRDSLSRPIFEPSTCQIRVNNATTTPLVRSHYCCYYYYFCNNDENDNNDNRGGTYFVEHRFSPH